jgi:asparagine synthase (glutamine-hydrolysing)
MCGIAGLLALRDGPPPRAEEIQAMVERLVHRGPDSDGFLIDGPAALGVRRLSIIDLEGGSQPIFSEDRSIAVFQNGEIYNFRELRAELEAKRHRFRTRSDTEVIVHLYEDVGERFVERLRGMFAIALFDRRRGRLLLARDRLGKKPLYYAELPNMLLFASELKSLLALPAFPRQLDEQALLDFFTFRGVPAPRSIFRSARKLPPAHLLVADVAGVRPPRPYWKLSFADPLDEPPERLAERLRELLDESVRLRLLADVPVGAFLSGGLDSSAVVAAMAAAQAGPVRTYCVGFDDPRHDERDEARPVAQALGSLHREQRVTLDPAVALEELPWYFDEPFADSSALPTYAVSRLARENVTVALSGDGGDETFAGYHRYLYDQRVGRVRKMLPPALLPLVRALAAVYPKGDWMPRRLRAKTVLACLGDDPLRAYFRSVRANDPALVLRQLSGSFRERLGGYDPFEVVHAAHARTDAPDPLGRLLQTDLSTYLVDDILTKVDRASMAASLEVRCPLLDHRLVELAARIPSHYKLRRGAGKWIFRRALEGLVPPSVLRRPKHGFDIPLRAWTRAQLRPAIERAIQDAPAEIFSRAALTAEWRKHRLGLSDRSELFWALLVFDAWRRRHAIPLG